MGLKIKKKVIKKPVFRQNTVFLSSLYFRRFVWLWPKFGDILSKLLFVHYLLARTASLDAGGEEPIAWNDCDGWLEPLV